MCKVYITFYKLERPKNRKTDIWEIITMDTNHLGYIKFDGGWRQFIFEPSIDTKWNYSCLEQVSKFLVEQNIIWRNSLKGKSVCMKKKLSNLSEEEIDKLMWNAEGTIESRC